MKKVVIFGVGGTGQRVYNMIKDDINVIGFVDNDSSKWGKSYDSKSIMNPKELCNLEFDTIVMGTLMGLEEVKVQLENLGIPSGKLDKTYVEISVKSRILFLKRFAERVYKEGIKGAVAEAGVFRGEFAKQINKFFPDRNCYLFDTFEGFDERDYQFEEQKSMIFDVDHFKETSEMVVLAKMPNKENVFIIKGYFPESIGFLQDDKFAFVNLDMDLYQPTLEGLRYFYPRMDESGIILIHDYFSEVFPNVEMAIDDFEKEIGYKLKKMPIGDDISMAIIK